MIEEKNKMTATSLEQQGQGQGQGLGQRLGRAFVFIMVCVLWVSYMTVEQEEEEARLLPVWENVDYGYEVQVFNGTTTNDLLNENDDLVDGQGGDEEEGGERLGEPDANAKAKSVTIGQKKPIEAITTPTPTTSAPESAQEDAQTTAAAVESAPPTTAGPTGVPTTSPITPNPTAPPTEALTAAAALMMNTNEFNPKLTIEDYLSQSSGQHSRPSDQWLQQCVTELEKDKDITKPFIDIFPADKRGPNLRIYKGYRGPLSGKSVQGNLYRLGDCILMCATCNNTLLGEDGNFRPGHNAEETIAGMYGSITECSDFTKPKEEQALYSKNFDVLEEIFHQIEHQKRPGFIKPGPNDFVIHLRLGDCIENSHQAEDKILLRGDKPTPADTFYLLTKGGKSHHAGYSNIKTIYSLNDYLDIIETLKTTKKVNKVHIVGGSHRIDQFYKSKVYAHCLQRGLAKAGYNVDMQIDGRHPDIDFYFMSNAKLFMQSSGGYSDMIGGMVKHLGGEVIGDDIDEKVIQVKQQIRSGEVENQRKRSTTNPATDNPHLATDAPTTSPTTPQQTVGPKTTPPAPDTNGDDFNAKLTIQDYLSLPEHSAPSKHWLQQCTTELVKDKDIYKPFTDPFRKHLGPKVQDASKSVQGNYYRLGDCIKGCSTCNNTLLEKDGNFRFGHNAEKTIAGMYGAITHCSGPFQNKQERAEALQNFDVLEEIFYQIEQQKRPGFEKPGPNDLVIHLRLGDVIEYSHQVEDKLMLRGDPATEADPLYLLTKGGKSHHAGYRNVKTIYSVDDYIHFIEAMKASNNINKIHLIGGSHRFELFKKSKIYAHCLQRGLAKAGYNVEMQIDGRHPDIDFYFMSNAKHFMQSTGGYSEMIGRMVQHLGGELFGDDLNKEAEEMQWAMKEENRRRRYTTSPTDTPGLAATATTEAPTTSPTSEPPVGAKTPAVTTTSFDANLAIEDYVSLPEHSLPSNDWLQQCVVELENDKDIYKPFIDPFAASGQLRGPSFQNNRLAVQGNLYRLGDCIGGCSTCNNTLLDKDGTFLPGRTAEDTIASMYGAITHCTSARTKEEREEALQNFDVLEEIFHQIEHQKRPGFDKPGPNDFVIHLRLGDVIENSHQSEDPILVKGDTPTPASTLYLLTKGGKSHHAGYGNVKTIYSVEDYVNVIETLKASKKVDKIHLIGGSHRYKLYKKSKVYAHCLQRGLALAGYDVNMQIDGRHPDVDFYFMSNAKLFMQSSGGYSAMIGHMVEHLGGEIVGDNINEKAEQVKWEAKEKQRHGGK